MKTVINSLLVAACFSGLTASAATIAWTGGGADNLIQNSLNWGGTLPLTTNGDVGTIDSVTIRGSTAVGGMTLLLTNVTWAQESTSGAGRDTDFRAGSSVTFNGGSFATRNATWRGNPNASQGIYTVNGLTLNVTNEFRLIQSPSVVWNSGTATCAVFTDQNNGTLHFDFADGTISANGAGAFVLNGGSYINFTGAKTGSLIARNADHRTTFDTYITAGKIKINGSLAALGDFSNFYDGTNTTLSIPTGTVPTVTLPATNTFFVGSTLSLSASVLGSLPLTYQWYTNGAALAGATTNPVICPNVQLSDAGSWSVLVTNLYGSAAATTEVVVVTAPAVITWDNGAGTTNIEDAANWDPDVLPKHAVGVPGLVATNETLTNVTVCISTPTGASGFDLTFEDGTVLQNRSTVDPTISGSTFIFNGASMFSIVSGRLPYFTGNTTMTFNNTASMNNSSRQYYFDGANNTLNFNDGSSATIARGLHADRTSCSGNTVNWHSTNTLQVGATYGLTWDKGTNNVLNLSSGKIAVGSGGFVFAGGNYINFTPGSTGVLDVQLAYDYSANFTSLVTNGFIRINGFVQNDMSAFALGGDQVLSSTLSLGTVPQVVAGFTGAPTSGGVPLTVTFTNLSSGAALYTWDFGNGQTSTSVNPVHIYTNAGTFSVTLTAVGAGGTNALTRTNYVVVTPASPVADFVGGPTNGVAPLTVTFTNLSSGASGYTWDFGDGQTSASGNPVNIYTNAGTFSVTLTAVGAGGTNALNRTNYVVVTSAPSLPATIQFTGITRAPGPSMVLTWTTTNLPAGVDIYRTENVGSPSWTQIDTNNQLNTYTDSVLTNRAFYQLTPTGAAAP